MARTPQTPAVIKFIDNPHAPELFAFQVAGIARFADNIHLTFESPHVDHVTQPGPVNRVVVGRLVMPVAGAAGLRDLLIDYLKGEKINTIDRDKLN